MRFEPDDVLSETVFGLTLGECDEDFVRFLEGVDAGFAFGGDEDG